MTQVVTSERKQVAVRGLSNACHRHNDETWV